MIDSGITALYEAEFNFGAILWLFMIRYSMAANTAVGCEGMC